MKKSEVNKWISQFLLIIAGIIGYVIIINYAVIGPWIGQLVGYLSPFLAGAVIAYLLDIPCSRFERALLKRRNRFVRAWARGLSIFFTLSICAMAIVFFIGMLIPQLAKSISEFIQNFPYYYANIVEFINAIESDGFAFLGLGDTIEFFLNSLLEGLAHTDLKNTLNLNFIWDSLRRVLTVSTYMINILIAIITSIYLLFDSKNIRQFFKKIFDAFAPEKSSKVISRYLKDANEYFKKFLYCNTLDGIMVGLISIVGFSISGVQYGVILGIFEGIANMIPYFGAIVGSVLVTIIVLIADGWSKALIVGVFLLVLQLIDGNVIKPKLYGDSFNISPFVVLLSITLGGSYYGVLGMIIAIPVVAIIRNIINDILEYRINKKKRKKKKFFLTKDISK